MIERLYPSEIHWWLRRVCFQSYIGWSHMAGLKKAWNECWWWKLMVGSCQISPTLTGFKNSSGKNILESFESIITCQNVPNTGFSIFDGFVHHHCISSQHHPIICRDLDVFGNGVYRKNGSFIIFHRENDDKQWQTWINYGITGKGFCMILP